jgi:predicted glycosyltransferase
VQPILYYVHHQGGGHWRRALAVAENLSRPVVFASSVPPPRALPASGSYVPLPLDYSESDNAGNQNAHGRLHWAPLHQVGLLARHRRLLDAVAEYRPALAVVDVSVEVTVILRTSGVPVTAVRLPGVRDDPAHHLGFGLADDVVMPVPADWGLHTGLPRTHAVGLVAAGSAGPAAENGGRRRAVVLVGTGGSRLDAQQCVRIARDLPDHQVQVLGLSRPARLAALPGNLSFSGRVQDPRDALGAASVAIGNTGLGTVADVITAGRPFVTLPEARPFDEQLLTAQALERHGTVVLRHLPRRGGWAEAVHRAESQSPSPLIADGAKRFAELINSRATCAAPPVIDLTALETA